MYASDDLISRVIRQESGGNPNAVSPAGAVGLMQIMPATARDPGFGVTPLDWSQVRNPDANRRFGTEYLNALLRRYDGDEERALVAYNWGAGNADKWNGDRSSLPEETQGYLRNILDGSVQAEQNELRRLPQPQTNALAAPRFSLPELDVRNFLMGTS